MNPHTVCATILFSLLVANSGLVAQELQSFSSYEVDSGFSTKLNTAEPETAPKADPAESTVSNVNFTSPSVSFLGNESQQPQSVARKNNAQHSMLFNFLRMLALVAVLGTLAIVGINYRKRMVEHQRKMRERWG